MCVCVRVRVRGRGRARVGVCMFFLCAYDCVFVFICVFLCLCVIVRYLVLPIPRTAQHGLQVADGVPFGHRYHHPSSRDWPPEKQKGKTHTLDFNAACI